MNQAQTLEQAILARAERLAAEYRERGRRSRDAILREAADKLRLREQREETIARTLGERCFRQQVQAEELKLQSHLDQVRWNLVLDVEARLAERMRRYMDNEPVWLSTLTSLIATAVAQIESPGVRVLANPRDLLLLHNAWAEVSAALPADRRVTLANDRLDTLGGVLVVSDDGRIRVDNTFEGRQARLRARLQQVILERLLPSGYDTGAIFGG